MSQRGGTRTAVGKSDGRAVGESEGVWAVGESAEAEGGAVGGGPLDRPMHSPADISADISGDSSDDSSADSSVLAREAVPLLCIGFAPSRGQS